MASFLKRVWLWLNDEETAAAPSRVDLALKDLPDWIADRQRVASGTQKLDSESRYFLQQIALKRTVLKEYAVILAEEIANPPAEVRLALEALEQVSALLSVPENASLRKAITVAVDGEPQLESLLAILKESDFLPDQALAQSSFSSSSFPSAAPAQVHPLVALVLELQAYTQRFRRCVTESKFSDFETVIHQAQQVQELAQHHQRLKETVANLQERLRGAESRWEHKKAELTLLEEDPHYASWRQLTHRRVQVQAQLEQVEDQLYQFFAALKPLMGLYAQKVEPDPLLREYLDAPFDTLLEDEIFRLESLLLRLKDALLTERVMFPRELVSAFLAQLEPSKIERVRNLRQQSLLLREQRKQLDDSLQHKNFLAKMDDAKYRLDHFSKQVGKWREEVVALEREADMGGKELTRALSVLQEKVRTLAEKDVYITV